MERRWRTIHKEGPSTVWVVAGARRSLCKAGDLRQLFPGPEIGSSRRDPPPPSHCRAAFRGITRPWDSETDVEAGDDEPTSGAAGGSCKGRSRRSSLPTRPKGACKLRRRVFPSGFPHHVEDFGPSHHFSRIPTAGGAASTAAAQPRIAAAGRGAVVRDLEGCKWDSTSTGTG